MMVQTKEWLTKERTSLPFSSIRKHAPDRSSTLEKEARRDPYSVAMLYSYMYHKEHEVNRLTIAIECIRYGVAPDEAMQYIRNN